MPVLAPMPVIDPVAVADVEALLAAIPPDRELHEPGKDLREAAVELPSVDLAEQRAAQCRRSHLPGSNWARKDGQP